MKSWPTASAMACWETPVSASRAGRVRSSFGLLVVQVWEARRWWGHDSFSKVVRKPTAGAFVHEDGFKKDNSSANTMTTGIYNLIYSISGFQPIFADVKSSNNMENL